MEVLLRTYVRVMFGTDDSGLSLTKTVPGTKQPTKDNM